MLDYRWKRLCSGLLALALVVGMLPPVAVAAEETQATEVVEVLETEPVTTDPVETEPVEATALVTVPSEVTEPTETTEETVPETTAETVAETMEATLPESVQAVQTLIDALLDVDAIKAMSTEEQRNAYDLLQNAYEAYEALNDEQKALIDNAEEIFASLFEFFYSYSSTAMSKSSENGALVRPLKKWPQTILSYGYLSDV